MANVTEGGEVKQLVVKGIYPPEVYQKALDEIELNLTPVQKEAIKKLSMAIGLGGYDIVKALKYYAFDKNIPLSCWPKV